MTGRSEWRCCDQTQETLESGASSSDSEAASHKAEERLDREMRTRIRRPRRFGLVPRKPTVKLATQDEARLAMALCQDKDGQRTALRRIWELVDTRKES